MISGLIPHRYAKALYKYALESKSTERVYKEMKSVITAFTQNPDMEKVMQNPFASAEDKRKLLLTAAGPDASDDYARFVKLILDHHREDFAMLMAYAYRDIYRRENKISEVKITTAAKLGDEEMQKLRKVVENAFKGYTFEYSYDVDPGLIGGFVIDVDSTRMNASLSNELEQLRLNLLESV